MRLQNKTLKACIGSTDKFVCYKAKLLIKESLKNKTNGTNKIPYTTFDINVVF